MQGNALGDAEQRGKGTATVGERPNTFLSVNQSRRDPALPGTSIKNVIKEVSV